ncbi:hypothetical protein SAY87_012044 [Trapa incisa]|uniref:ER membrane protein complex subunit 10 n=2 Tax=Trapa TaxID=22665 RepID=A0AAN7MG67_TRANT|nr:hypothetical protein SAY87_012044 [Trapa incisa]KAK4796585.1 hypothetical protein SAY86_028911 [Trapa natans]
MEKLMLILGLAMVFVGLGLSMAFHSDELLVEDEEFGLEGSATDVPYARPSQPTPTRKRSSDPDSDSKIQFSLEHAFGESEFSPAGTFTARLKTWSQGAQTLTKLRFSRNSLTEAEMEQFQKLLQGDDFYRIRLPSNVLNPPGRDYIVSSVKARCLPRDGLDEHFVIHTEGVNILAVNYGAPGACPYPRQLKLPSKWAFNSYTILKNTEQAPRTPVFTEEITVGENGEIQVPPPEKSFWAKYWMYLIPLGLIVMNAMTQAMNMPEEQAASQGQQGGAAAQRAPVPAVRRR